MRRSRADRPGRRREWQPGPNRPDRVKYFPDLASRPSPSRSSTASVAAAASAVCPEVGLPDAGSKRAPVGSVVRQSPGAARRSTSLVGMPAGRRSPGSGVSTAMRSSVVFYAAGMQMVRLLPGQSPDRRHSRVNSRPPGGQCSSNSNPASSLAIRHASRSVRLYASLAAWPRWCAGRDRG